MMGATSIILLSLTLTLTIRVFLFPGSVLFYMPHLLHAEYYLDTLNSSLFSLENPIKTKEGKIIIHSGRKFKKQKLQVCNYILPDISSLVCKTKLISSLWYLGSPAS